MNYFHITAKIIIASGIVITALTAIEHITGRLRDRRDYFRFFRGMIISVLIAQLAAIGLGYHLEHYFVLFPFLTFLYLHSPLEFIRYYRFLHPGRKIPGGLKLSILPAVPLFILELYIQLLPQGRKRLLFEEFYGDPLGHWMIYVYFACILVLISYACLLLYVQIDALKESALKRPLRFSIMMSIVFLASVVIMCMYWFTMDSDLVLLGDALISLLVIVYFLFKNRFPVFFQLLAREMRLKRYRRTLLEGLNLEAIHERLSELMNDERLYQDMDLRMSDVAAQLMITPHQLSQLLNERNKTDFRNYVNHFRIDEAKKLLVEEPERSVISICFHVGFNSKTAFNITFKKMTGSSPKEFRENFGKRL